ncbi:MAG: transcriptional regulator, ArsR family [Actinotalea sp.]|nr:transcriptional regulator, ArsR family [Actinotalea sp.]
MTVTTTFSALADPTRLAVVSRLGSGEATISELAATHPMSLPAFTRHIRVLVDAGLVTRRKVGRSVVCRLAPEPLGDAQSWLTDVTAFWTAGPASS